MNPVAPSQSRVIMEVLRELIRARGLRNRDLASEFGVSERTVIRWFASGPVDTVTVTSPRAGLVMDRDAKVKYRGVQIGEVADISYDDEDQPNRIRMTTGSVLGLGSRTLEIPAGLFTVLRGAVVVDLPAEAIETLPELAEQEEER